MDDIELLTEPLEKRLEKVRWQGLESDIYCNENEFVHLVYVASTSIGQIVMTYRLETIRFNEVDQVRLKHRGGPLLAFLVTVTSLGIYGPWLYDLELVFQDGRLIRVSPPDWQTRLHSLNSFPLWLYPYHLIHGDSQGEAIDFLSTRAHAPSSTIVD